MKTNNTTTLLGSFLILLTILSCSSENSVENTTIDKIDNEGKLQSHLNLNEGSTKVFTMPTPLQISTALHIMKAESNTSILLPYDIDGFNTNETNAINLGAYIVDLGYTTIYNDQQLFIYYSKKIQNIIDNVGISTYANNGLHKRIESNRENQDSLFHIIQETYANGHQHISESKDESMGLMVFAGAYIEGLYLLSNAKVNPKWIKEYDNVLMQQKVFLENFILLLGAYEEDNREVKKVRDELIKLDDIFIAIDVIVKKSDNNQKLELETPLKQADKTNIREGINILRNKLLPVEKAH